MRSIRSTLSIGGPLLLLVFVLILGAISYGAMRRGALENALAITKLTADSREEMLVRYLQRQKGQAEKFAERTVRLCHQLSTDNAKCLRAALQEYIGTTEASAARLSLPGHPPIVVGDPSRSLPEAGSLPAGVMADFRTDKSGEPYFVIEARSDTSGHILTLHSSLETVHEIFSNPEELGEFGETFLVSPKGFYLSPPDFLRPLTGDEAVAESRPVKRCRTGQNFDDPTALISGRSVLVSYRTIEEIGGGCVVAFVSDEFAFQGVRDLTRDWLRWVVAFTLLAAAAGYLLTRRITHPIDELSAAVQALQEGDHSVEIRTDGGPRELRLFAQAFSSMAKSIKEQVRNREEMVAIVSHDLKTPLSALMLNSQVGRRILKAPESESRRAQLEEILSRMEFQSQRMSRLIGELMDVTRIQTGRLLVEPKICTIDSLARTVESFRPLAEEKGIHYQVEMENPEAELFCDYDRLAQVLSNLIGNAIKFTDRGGRITVGEKRVAGDFIFWVSDTGPGIPGHQLSHVFEKHWQATGTDKKGIGLGLFISKGIVEGHGGKIWVESELGYGATFFVSLPATQRQSRTKAA